MPTYAPPLKGIQLSVALAEAAAIAPVTRVILDTFEIYHPALQDPIRVVNDFEDLNATLEPTAPRNPYEMVEFIACAVRITRGEESDTAAAPEITLTVDNVSGLMSDALKLTRDSLEPWEIINRIYASDDLTGPAMLPPLSLHILSVDISPTTITLHCQYADFVNIGVPATTFKLDEYPGLDTK